jgi:hypothetical protein
MIKAPRLIACMLSLAGLCGTSAMAATQVYKWVDDQGQVHYTESPPPKEVKSRSVMVVHSGVPEGANTAAPAATAGSGAAAANNKTDKQKAADAKIAEQNKALCPQWQQDVKTINSVGKLRTMDENGELHFMTEDEKNARLEQDQSSISQYCN